VTATTILWVCWLFFNGGSVESFFVPKEQGSAKIMINTILAGAAAGTVAHFLRPRMIKSDGKYDLSALCNGILAGLVSITAVCH